MPLADDGTLLPRTEQIFQEQHQSIVIATDRLFMVLLLLQWVVAIVVALVLSSQNGAQFDYASYYASHSHVWTALLLGGIIISLPIGLVLRLPGKTPTRSVVAIAQMIMSALLIRTCDGQLETDFYIFGSLAVLAFYRDWRVLVTASTVMVLDHLLGFYLAPSVLGNTEWHSILVGADWREVPGGSQWRWAEHAGWILIEDIFLIGSCRRSLAKMWAIAERQAALESTNAQLAKTAEELRVRSLELAQARDHLEGRVQERTRELEASRTDMRRVIEQANCLLWAGQVHEARIAPFPHATIFDSECHTFLHWDIQVMNEAEVLSWLPIALQEGDPFFASWIKARHPEDDRTCDERSTVALLSGSHRYSQAFRSYLADGTMRWLQEDVHIESLHVESVEAQQTCVCPSHPLRRWQVTGVVTDITEQKRAEERQKEMSEQLTRSNTALQEFFFITSHDLKEPLRKIQSFGNLLRRKAGPSLAPETQPYLDRMTDAAYRMQVLLQALLEYAQVIGKVREIETVDLNAVAARVLVDLEGVIEEIKPCIEIGPLPTVQADPVQMRQLFYQLLANALKFRRQDVRAQVRVTATCDDKGISLIFADNGIGFAPEYADRIFQMFERLERSGHTKDSVKDSGVGLSICKKVVERHEGTIVAQGCDGEGATFRVWLPHPERFFSDGNLDRRTSGGTEFPRNV